MGVAEGDAEPGVLAAVGRAARVVHREGWTTALTMTAWDGTVVRLLTAGAVLLGVLMVVAALGLGAPGSLPLPTTTDGVDVRAQRRGVDGRMRSKVSLDRRGAR